MSLAATGGEPCAAFGRLSGRIRVVPHRSLRCAILIAGSLCWGEYDAALPGKSGAFLSPRLFVVRRFCRQLQHGCLLAFAQEEAESAHPAARAHHGAYAAVHD